MEITFGFIYLHCDGAPLKLSLWYYVDAHIVENVFQDIIIRNLSEPDRVNKREETVYEYSECYENSHLTFV